MEILPNQTDQNDKKIVTRERLDDFFSSNEQVNLWFTGSIMRTQPHHGRDFKRLAPLHNRITHLDTNFDDRFQANYRVAGQLTEFFPSSWCWEITDRFRNIEAMKLTIKSEEDRINAFLGAIELYLTFRGLTLLESTIDEINNSMGINLTKNDIRSWKLKILRIYPDLLDQWKKIRAPSHQTAIVGTVIRIMNQELILNSLISKEIFEVKQKALSIVQTFVQLAKARCVKNVEVWARAVCLKALRDCGHSKGKDFDSFFPKIPSNVLKTINSLTLITSQDHETVLFFFYNYQSL